MGKIGVNSSSKLGKMNFKKFKEIQFTGLFLKKGNIRTCCTIKHFFHTIRRKSPDTSDNFSQIHGVTVTKKIDQ